MKIVWLDINSSYSHSNLGLPALHAQISPDLQNSFEWVKVSGTINTNPEEIITTLLHSEADVLMATTWLFNHSYLLNIIEDFVIL